MALSQLARIIGPEFRERQGVAADEPFPDELTAELQERVRALTSTHAEHIAAELADEASASDDVQDTESAAAYLEDRLRFFGPLLAEETRQRVRERFAGVTRQWAATEAQ
jgi:hypothetical protein